LNNIKIDCVLDAKANLGEGAIWSVKDQILYWVDINRGLLCKYNPENGKNIAIDFKKPLGCFALKSNLNVILALTDGFFEFDQNQKTKTLIDSTESNILENRFNDGTVDIKGRFYAGTMAINGSNISENAKGSLYCLEPSGKVNKTMDGFYTINGLAFSPDYKTAYVSDSAYWIQTIWAYDYDLDNGIWSNKRTFFDTKNVAGRPDGGCIDAEGCYWMAGVSGWELLRITPQGKIDMTIKMPIEKPTKIAFGGSKLDTMYVTSIGQDNITEGTAKLQPKAGGLFALCIPGVKGIEFPCYG
jgi:sugar lactone lactonase YvrE